MTKVAAVAFAGRGFNNHRPCSRPRIVRSEADKVGAGPLALVELTNRPGTKRNAVSPSSKPSQKIPRIACDSSRARLYLLVPPLITPSSYSPVPTKEAGEATGVADDVGRSVVS